MIDTIGDTMPELPRWAEWLGLSCTVLGFLLTIYTLISVIRLRNQYFLKARGPSVIKALNASYKVITKIVSSAAVLDAPAGQQAREEVKKCAITLRWLKRRSTGELLSATKSTLAKCASVLKKPEPVRSSDMGLISTELACVVAAYEMAKGDAEWSK